MKTNGGQGLVQGLPRKKATKTKGLHLPLSALWSLFILGRFAIATVTDSAILRCCDGVQHLQCQDAVAPPELCSVDGAWSI